MIHFYHICKIFLSLIVLIILSYYVDIYTSQNKAFASNYPIATDSRIKTFVYSENEVFPIILHYGYQTSLEFGRGETVQTYSVGNSYAWQFSSVGRTMFIKPLEENIITNMTVITNKRRYYFELHSKSLIGASDEELSYAIRFFYPDELEDQLKPEATHSSSGSDAASVPVIKPYNFNYKISGSNKVAPTSVFDDGINTYFEYEKEQDFTPEIFLENDKKVSLDLRRVGNYLVTNNTGSKFTIVYKRTSVVVTANKTK